MKISVYLKSYVTKKGERRWLLIIRERGGKDQTITLGAISKREAEQRRAITLNELLSGNFQRVSAVRLLFGEFIDKVVEYAAGMRAARTVELYRTSLKSAREAFRGLRLDQIRREDIERLLVNRRVSGRTRNIELSVLRLIFSKAVEWGCLLKAPTEGVRRFREECQGSRPLTPDEIARLLQTATPWTKALIKVMIYSGLRPGEAAHLKFADLCWETKTLRVVNDRQRQTKTRKSRVIPLSPDLETELRFLSEHWPNPAIGCGKDDLPWYLPRTAAQRVFVFCKADGTPIQSFHHSLQNAFRRAGITGVTPHGLRKTFCSMLARYGVHPKVAQQLLGHSDPRLTMNIYTEVQDDQLHAAVHALPTCQELQRGKLTVINGGAE